MNAKSKWTIGLLSSGLVLGGGWMLWHHRFPKTAELLNDAAELVNVAEPPERWERPADKARYLRARLPVERRSLEVVREALAQAKEPFFPDRERVRQLEELERVLATRVENHESELRELGAEGP